MESRTLVVSDTHLCAVAADDEAWLPYRTRAFQFDDALATLLRRADRAARDADATLTLVFNGDTFDFDAPDPPRPEREARRLGAATLGSLPERARAIVNDHAAWADAVAEVVARPGRRALFVAGNHDAALARRDVQDAVCEALGVPAGFATQCARTDEGFLVEHGHQYDAPCALATPFPRATGAIEETVGSLISKHAPSILGCVNPFEADPLAVTPHALWVTVRGCGPLDRARPLRQLAELGVLNRRLAALDTARTAEMEAVMVADIARACRTGRVAAARHVALYAAKVDMRWLAAAAAGSGYGEALVRDAEATSYRVAAIHGARGVVRGHTHVPAARWTGGVFYGNTGTWAPLARGATTPGGAGHFAWLSSGRRGTHATVARFDGRAEGPLP